MSEFRILDWNFLFDESTLLSASSADAAFPVSNLRRHHRSKVWRSSGYFKLTADKKIDFQEVLAGPQLTATIPSGEYTAEALALVVAGQMQVAAGASGSYTCSISAATGRWTITQTIGSFLSLLFSTGTNTATSIASILGFDTTTDYTDALTYTGSRISIHTEERVVFDLGVTPEIDSFAAFFDPEDGHKFSTSAVLKLQANATDAWDAPDVDVTLSFDDAWGCITHFFSTAQSFRYWSISIVDTDNPYLYVELSKVVLSKATQLGQMPSLPFTSRLVDRSRKEATAYGNIFADVYPTARSLSFSYQWLTAEDEALLEEIFRRIGSVVPIVVALDPTATVFDKDRFVLYGRLRESFDVENPFLSFFNAPFILEEAF